MSSVCLLPTNACFMSLKIWGIMESFCEHKLLEAESSLYAQVFSVLKSWLATRWPLLFLHLLLISHCHYNTNLNKWRSLALSWSQIARYLLFLITETLKRRVLRKTLLHISQISALKQSCCVDICNSWSPVKLLIDKNIVHFTMQQ